jgi:hypothetical protein
MRRVSHLIEYFLILVIDFAEPPGLHVVSHLLNATTGSGGQKIDLSELNRSEKEGIFHLLPVVIDRAGRRLMGDVKCA